MTSLTSCIPRPVVLAATTAAGLLLALTTVPSAAAVTTSAPPECVQHHSSWRYTHVVNGCDAAIAVTVEYADGQTAPCRVIEPGTSATFAGYGPGLNYVTGLQTCEPDSVTSGGA
ncbi:alpha-amylase [Streptomyces sp. NPDC058664]|uniref:alpha-amylase n=1 Tax=unclassified Streptomyces TaxID=2593676 RepID=UPI0036644E59